MERIDSRQCSGIWSSSGPRRAADNVEVSGLDVRDGTSQSCGVPCLPLLYEVISCFYYAPALLLVQIAILLETVFRTGTPFRWLTVCLKSCAVNGGPHKLGHLRLIVLTFSANGSGKKHAREHLGLSASMPYEVDHETARPKVRALLKRWSPATGSIDTGSIAFELLARGMYEGRSPRTI